MPKNPSKLFERILQNSSQLKELVLHDCRIVHQDCSKIASSPKVHDLEKLDISCNRLGFAGFCNLLDPRTSNLAKLEKLELYNCSIEAPS